MSQEAARRARRDETSSSGLIQVFVPDAFAPRIVAAPGVAVASPEPWIVIAPAICSIPAGDVVPIPTCPRVRYMSLDAMAHDC